MVEFNQTASSAREFSKAAFSLMGWQVATEAKKDPAFYQVLVLAQLVRARFFVNAGPLWRARSKGVDSPSLDFLFAPLKKSRAQLRLL
eukprot:1900675-Amphidinium_carterae.1